MVMEIGMSDDRQRAGKTMPAGKYESPKLTVYGAITSLTAAGSTGGDEAMTTDPTRKA